MDKLSIRPARAEDSPHIRALIRIVRINPTGLDWRRFLVALDPRGALIGCGQIKPHGDGSRELASIAVREEDRGRGVARALIEALLEQEQQRPLFLMCRARLSGLYARFGFAAVTLAEMPTYFRGISRIEHLLNSKAAPEDRLMVMRLD